MASGTELVGGRIPGERIATTKVTADSPGFTTGDTQMASVVAPLVIGQTYAVVWRAGFGSTVAGDTILSKILEDTDVGTQIQHGQLEITTVSSVVYGPLVLYGEYTALATANKTFVAVADRNTGTGTCRLDATAGSPAFLYVNYISG